jgi:hypothetical protein
MENVVVGQCAVPRQNLLAGTTGGDCLKNALQPCPEFFWFHIGPSISVAMPALTALAMPEFWKRWLFFPCGLAWTISHPLALPNTAKHYLRVRF